MVAPPCGSPYRAVAHAVAVDAFYDTDADRISQAYEAAIQGLVAEGCLTIAAACLGCGYGHCSIDEFLPAIEALRHSTTVAPIRVFVFVTTNDELARRLAEALQEAA